MTTLTASFAQAEQVRIAIADERGDGRPDYNYQARVLYADSVSPAAVNAAGGVVTITGMGFRTGNAVLVNGVAATVNELDCEYDCGACALAEGAGVEFGVDGGCYGEGPVDRRDDGDDAGAELCGTGAYAESAECAHGDGDCGAGSGRFRLRCRWWRRME